MPTRSEDRRGGPRLNLAVPVTLRLDREECQAHTMNMSCRGFLLLTDELLPSETQFLVEMKLPETDAVLLAECEVIWLSENISIGPEVHRGMGVKLIGFKYLEKQHESDY